VDTTAAHNHNLLFGREGYGALKVESVDFVLGLQLFICEIHRVFVLVLLGSVHRFQHLQIHNSGLEIQLSVGHESEDCLVVVVAANGRSDIVPLRNLGDVLPLIGHSTGTFTLLRRVKEAIPVFESADEDELLHAVAAHLDDSGPHTTLWHLRNFSAGLEAHVRVELQQPPLLDEGLIGQLKGEVTPLVNHKKRTGSRFP